MPLPLLAIAGGIQAAGALAKTIKGFGDLKSANELARNNIRPTYNIEDEYYNNQSLAENNAQTGLSQQSLDYYGNQANRGLSAGIDATLQGGGGINSIQNLYDQYLQGGQKVAAEDSQLKNQNLKILMDQNAALAGQKTQQWVLNQYEPYKDKAQAASAAKTAATQNIFGGISGLASGAAVASQGFKDPSAVSGAAATPAVSGYGGPIVSATGTAGTFEDPYFNNQLQDMIKKRYSSSPYVDNFTTSNRATV